METSANSAADCWKEAQKYRRMLLQKLELLQKNESKGNEVPLLEALEDALKSFRLGCMATVFTDFHFAVKQHVENMLWQAHGAINSEYRKIVARLESEFQSGAKVVLGRQVGRMYVKFLRTSQHFYKGYVQRLSARYKIPELERIAGCLKSEGGALDDVQPDNDPELPPKVLRSCHRTLLRLGDLARYRRSADRRAHGFEAPLLYYRLAHEILPMSGYGHHQMAVVYLGDKEHDLPVIYHLYRALAVQEPHPNAAQNLEHQLKKLLPGSAPRGVHAALDPKATLATWVVRLHALLYQGEAVGSQQQELEREVLHRMQILCTSKDCRELLFQIVLTNMAAYYVARQRADKEWTYALSLSCQNLLQFNVRTMLVISRALGTVIREAIKSVSAPQAGGESSQDLRQKAEADKHSERFLAALETAVPLLRTYMVWLCMHRLDMVKYATHLSPYISEMHQSLADTVSVIIELFRDDTLIPATSKYMLSEDLDTLYFEPLNKSDVVFVCRSMHFTLDGRPKPRLGGSDSIQQQSSNVETLCRINDIINCGYFLGTDPMYPLRVVQTQQGSRTLTLLAFAEADEVGDTIMSATDIFSAAPATPDAAVGDKPAAITADDQIPYELSKERAKTAAASSAAIRGASDPEGANHVSNAEFGVDNETFNRVNEFLTPPEAHSPAGAAVDESSYGMHSSTANDIFRALNSNPDVTTPTSATSKAFPALPWNLIYTPTPYRPSSGHGLHPESNAVIAACFETALENDTGVGPAEALGLPQSVETVNRGSHLQQLEQGVSGQQLQSRNFAVREPNGPAWAENSAKRAAWKTAATAQPSVPSGTLPSASPVSSHGSPSGRMLPPQPRAPSAFAPPSPYFQSSNFSALSSLPQVGGFSPWVIEAAATRAGGLVINGHVIPGMNSAPPLPSSVPSRNRLNEETLASSSPPPLSQQPVVSSANWTAAATAWNRAQAAPKDDDPAIRSRFHS